MTNRLLAYLCLWAAIVLLAKAVCTGNMLCWIFGGIFTGVYCVFNDKDD